MSDIKLSDIIRDMCERAGMPYDEEAVKALDEVAEVKFTPGREPDPDVLGSAASRLARPE